MVRTRNRFANKSPRLPACLCVQGTFVFWSFSASFAARSPVPGARRPAASPQNDRPGGQKSASPIPRRHARLTELGTVVSGTAGARHQRGEGVVKGERGSSFAHRVLAVVRRIPPGRIATYGDVARMAGRPRAARAVGNIMRNCSRHDVPCHRVVAAGGQLGGYGGSLGLKRSLLRAEGLVVVGSRIREANARRWTGSGPWSPHQGPGTRDQEPSQEPGLIRRSRAACP
jgi:O-6-methylguanine DNA methyltransferase